MSAGPYRTVELPPEPPPPAPRSWWRRFLCRRGFHGAPRVVLDDAEARLRYLAANHDNWKILKDVPGPVWFQPVGLRLEPCCAGDRRFVVVADERSRFSYDGAPAITRFLGTPPDGMTWVRNWRLAENVCAQARKIDARLMASRLGRYCELVNAPHGGVPRDVLQVVGSGVTGVELIMAEVGRVGQSLVADVQKETSHYGRSIRLLLADYSRSAIRTSPMEEWPPRMRQMPRMPMRPNFGRAFRLAAEAEKATRLASLRLPQGSGAAVPKPTVLRDPSPEGPCGADGQPDQAMPSGRDPWTA